MASLDKNVIAWHIAGLSEDETCLIQPGMIGPDIYPDIKVHVANMGGPHVGPMSLAIGVSMRLRLRLQMACGKAHLRKPIPDNRDPRTDIN